MLTKIVLVLTLCNITEGNQWPYLENCRILFVPNRDKAMCNRRLGTWAEDKTTMPHYFKGEVPALKEGEVIVGKPYCETMPFTIEINPIIVDRWNKGLE